VRAELSGHLVSFGALKTGLALLFEAIHPFLDGNGRVGRLLVSLLLCAWKLLPQPFLHWSAYAEARRSEYYQLLMAVTQRGDWENWLQFFLTSVREQSIESQLRVKALADLRDAYRQKLQEEHNLARLIQAVDFIIGQPILTSRQMEAGLGLSHYLAAQRLVAKLENYGILREITGQARNRVYRVDEVLQVIDAPAEHLE